MHSALGLVPFCGWDSGWVEVLGVLQLNVCTKRFVQHFTGFSQSTRAVGHGLFDADDLMALRALAEAMTRAIHFVLWPKPSHVGQFWLFHAPSFPQARGFGYTVQIMLTHYRLLALVVRKGSNFEPLLCGLSPPVSGGRLKAHMDTFWT